MSSNGSNLGNAFARLLSIHCRSMTLEKIGVGTYDIKATPSNYFRNLAGPEETVIEGREFVITKSTLDVHNIIPKRNDRLRDPELGMCVIVEVREIIGFGGAILGYRVRTS